MRGETFTVTKYVGCAVPAAKCITQTAGQNRVLNRRIDAAVADQGTRVSQAHTLLLLLMMLAIPMIPYVIFYLMLVKEKAREPVSRRFTHPFRKMFAWGHVHSHPQLLHY